MHICRYFHDDEALPETVRAELEDVVYASFVADRRAHPRPSGAVAPLRETMDRLTRTLTLTEFTAGNERLSERLAHEAVHWVSERWAELEASDPFDAEERGALEQVREETA
ncbi:MAG: hypothetical protein ACOC1U_09305, partial [Spirochaetota bacterium]